MSPLTTITTTTTTTTTTYITYVCDYINNYYTTVTINVNLYLKGRMIS